MGRLGALAESVREGALELFVELGRVLRQPGDVLEVGSEQLLDMEVKRRQEDRDKERRKRESTEKLIRQGIQASIDNTFRAYGREPEADLLTAVRDDLAAQIKNLTEVEPAEGHENGLKVME